MASECAAATTLESERSPVTDAPTTKTKAPTTTTETLDLGRVSGDPPGCDQSVCGQKPLARGNRYYKAAPSATPSIEQ